MKVTLSLAAVAGLSVVLAQNATTLSTYQQSCVDSTLAANGTCGSTYTACACDNTFVQNVKICLYQGSCSSDVATWFDTATAACDASGQEANYTSTHSENYTYSESGGSSSTAPVSSAAAATSAAASAAASSSGSSSGAPQQYGAVGTAALTLVGVVVGTAMLF
ncbi:hypothetical protein I204_06952 [Kwoniella mangroviensis CBS 8886]|uniref:uncharacterized protein n=1 Tax=Kwoniella mangroviensis CBS 8507 TaxID=1296122 RepID=UPI00080D6748|nr:uncharacterized protein I203_01076 [Kwoniella mangroviensis CBS 8507]OCF69222.1 hypothetical protein I203_01076 [Kwoniella mangroviensis CBS 8507]OCF72570.1 hypothetical protein I204_06952 [Kwoniella mangroviensis CBS 8886]